MGTVNRLVTCAAVGLAASFAWNAAAFGAVYGGETAQAGPVVITLGKSGQVKSVAINWSAECQSGQSYTFGRVLTAAKKPPKFIGPGDNPLFGAMKKGKLSATALGTADFGDAGSGSISQKISGKFKPKKASGTWSAHMDVVDAGGTKIDSCDTGTIRWAAMHDSTVYGGTTTQGEPVVVITKKDRSRVGYFGFAWASECTPAGSDFWHVAEEFGNFPLTGSGAFGDTFSNEYPYKDGTGKNTFTYSVSGSLRKTTGSGTLSVHVVEADTAGTATATCDTNSVRWSVRQ